MSNNTKIPKLQHFRQILFWPLRLIPPNQDKTNWEKKGCTAYIQKFLLPTSSPWIPLNEKLYNRETASSEITCYAELLYFHPFIRSFLYSGPDLERPILRLFKRTDVKKLQIVLREGQELKFDVDRIHLYIFDIEIAILVMEISSTNLESTELSEIQDFLDQFRHVYPPYWDEFYDGSYKAGHCPQTVTFFGKKDQELIKGTYNAPKEFLPFIRHNKASPVTKHWCFLLEPFVPYECSQWDNDKVRYQQLEDERMPYMAYLAFDNPRLLTKGDIMRLGFAESSGDRDSLPYSSNSQFSQNFEQDYCYDYYWETNPQYHDRHDWMNTRYICCGYAFTMIGGSNFFNDDKVGALAHFKHHYFQIGLIVHFHKAGLFVLWDKLHKKAEFLTYPNSREVKQILQKLQHLTKLFSEVSTLGQAKKLFNLWEHHLGIKDSLERALKETQGTHERLEIEEQKQQTDITARLTVVATVGLAVALSLGVFGGELQKIWGSEVPTLGALSFVFSAFGLGVLVTLYFSQQLSHFIDIVATKRMWQWLKNKFKGD